MSNKFSIFNQTLVNVLIYSVAIILFSSLNVSYAQKELRTNELSEWNDIQPLDFEYYAIVINDSKEILFNSEKEAEKTLQKLKNMYRTKDTEEISFQEKVNIKKVYKSLIELDNLKTSEKALEYILNGTTEEKKYTVQRGDSFWSIAKSFDIPVNHLMKANPTIVPERLQINQEVSLVVPKPIIHVITKEKAEFVEKIPFEVTYEESDKIYQDEYRVQRRGINGKKKVIANLLKKDGEEVAREIISEDILQKPSKQIVIKGTKKLPPKKGTGVFTNPLSRGRLTEDYGWRVHPITRRKNFHPAVDIAAPLGDPIYAADGGDVIYVGWRGTYGKTIIIDHGQNKTTLYAHMNGYNVSEGEKVYKGKIIGRIGSTGRSTGPHLHFEIRNLDKALDPFAYINNKY